jgi:tRNA(Ile)-lysidine synthase
MHEVEDAFLKAVSRHRMIEPGDRLLAAVSGGADSTLLLHLLAAHRARCPFTLEVAHLNHGLRGADGDADEGFVAGLAGRLALPLAAARADLARKPRESSSLEERARDARREFLRATAEERGCNKIALGHTLDDQAETILMWLLRGAGRGALSGMEPMTPDGVIRPLLGLRRRQVRAHLAGIGEPYRVDATNDDPSHLRNRIRLRLITVMDAEFPGGVETMASASEVLAAEDAFLDGAAAALLEEGRLSARALAAAPAALGRRAIRIAARRSGLVPHALTRHHVDQILALAADSAEEGGVSLPGGGRAVRRGSLVLFTAGEQGGSRRR